MATCPFCSLPEERIVARSTHGLAIRDAYPISPGHTLILPRRHAGSFFSLDADEQGDLLALLKSAKAALDKELAAPAYNLGINDGPVAGQTVPHVHIHLIPRFEGDVPDPRGGVRWVIPEKADYWNQR